MNDNESSAPHERRRHNSTTTTMCVATSGVGGDTTETTAVAGRAHYFFSLAADSLRPASSTAETSTCFPSAAGTQQAHPRLTCQLQILGTHRSFCYQGAPAPNHPVFKTAIAVGIHSDVMGVWGPPSEAIRQGWAPHLPEVPSCDGLDSPTSPTSSWLPARSVSS